MEEEKFQETQLGKIPKEWDVVKIGDFFDLKAGSTPSRSRPDFFQGNIPWVSSGELDYNIIRDTKEKITQEAVEKTSLTIVPEGTFMLAITGLEAPGTRGRCAILGVQGTMNQSCVAFRKNDEYLSEYLFYFYLFHSEHIYFKYAQGTKQQSLPQKVLKVIPFHKPPLTEQKGIVDILTLWEEASSKIEELIEAKKRHKKGLMQQLLSGEKRFPEFEKESWIEVKLGEVFNERKEKDCTHLDLVAITTDNGIIDRDELDRKDTSSSNKDNYKRIAPGDIGYNTMRMWQGVSGYSELEGIVSPAYTIVIPVEDKIDGRFMSYLFKYPPIIDLFRRYSQGLVSDTLNLKYDNFAQIKVTIPQSIKEQQKIREVLMSVDKEIDLLNEKLNAIQKQKKGLMQKLLTGKVRVNQKLTESESYG